MFQVVEFVPQLGKIKISLKIPDLPEGSVEIVVGELFNGITENNTVGVI